MGNKVAKPSNKANNLKDTKLNKDPAKELERVLTAKNTAKTSTLTFGRKKPKPLPKPENGNLSEEQRIQIIKVVQNGQPPQLPSEPKQPLPSISGVDSNDNIVIAMYAYKAQNTGDLSFRKGEKLEVVEKSDPDWWTVKRIETGEIGYIPANYVGTTAIESEE